MPKPRPPKSLLPNLPDVQLPDLSTMVVTCYEPAADELHIKEIRNQYFDCQYPHWWHMKEFSKTFLTILGHDLKCHEQKFDPISNDDWNQNVIWPMHSVTKWIARRLTFTRHFETWGLRRAFDACRFFNLPRKVNRTDWLTVDIPANIAIKWLAMCSFVTSRFTVLCTTGLTYKGTFEICRSFRYKKLKSVNCRLSSNLCAAKLRL